MVRVLVLRKTVDRCRHTTVTPIETRETPAGSKAPSPAAKAAAAYERLRGDLLSGVFEPGERLSEALLSRTYQVSRSPIREATFRLERDGLVERDGMVVRVRKRDAPEILDIYRVRVHLEGAIAQDAAVRRNEVDLVTLDAIVAAEEAAHAADAADMVRLNRAFHAALATAAHNATLHDLQDRLTAQVAYLPSTTLLQPGRWEQSRREHRALVAAVRAGDGDAARAIAESHMSTAKDLRLAIFQQQASDEF